MRSIGDDQWVDLSDYRFCVRKWENPSTVEAQATATQDASSWKSWPYPILWLHGFMGSVHDWDAVVNEWGDRPSCIAIDLPGHGKTDVTGTEEQYAMPSTAQGIVQLLDALDIRRCGLVGYSMGGRLALYLALQYPERFCCVALESASPGLHTANEQDTRRTNDAALAQTLRSTNFEQFIEQWYQQPLFASLNQHLSFPSVMNRRLRNDPNLLARSLQWMGTGQQPSLWDALGKSTTPLLLIVGEHDTKYRQIASEIGDRHPNCTTVTVPNCGHTVHVEQPAQFLTHIRTFVQSSFASNLSISHDSAAPQRSE